MSSYGGVCILDGSLRLEYQVQSLEYIPGKSLSIEAICLNPKNKFEEVLFRHSTNNLVAPNEKLDIAFSIIHSLIKDLDLPGDLIKLSVRDRKVFYLCSL